MLPRNGGRVLLILHQGAVLLRMLLRRGLLLGLASMVWSVGSLVVRYGWTVVVDNFGVSVALLFGLTLTP